MFEKNADQRLVLWSEFRKRLETSTEPIQLAIDYYSYAPMVSIHTDPWDNSTWPTPWELLQENQYCEFCRVLGLCYSLQLTDRFSNTNFEIHIITDSKNSATKYLLIVGDSMIVYTNGEAKLTTYIPDYYEVKKKYNMNKSL